MAILSAIDVFTVIDQAGNPRTTGWFDMEFRENYALGGIGIDLTPYFRTVRDIIPRFASGDVNYLPAVNESDLQYPLSAHTVSTRIKLMAIGSGRIQILSGLTAVRSGYGGRIILTSGQAVASGTQSSGHVHMMLNLAVSGFVVPPRQFVELEDTTAISGMRARLLVMGY